MTRKRSANVLSLAGQLAAFGATMMARGSATALVPMGSEVSGAASLAAGVSGSDVASGNTPSH